MHKIIKTESGGLLIKNEGELLDVIPYIPETEVNEKIMTNLENIDIDESDKRVFGYLKWFYSSTYSGNRNANLFRLGMFMRDLGRDYASEITKANAQISEPLSDGEIKKIINSINKK